MNKIYVFLIIVLIFLVGCQGKTEIANPASVYCEEQGGKLEIATEPNGGQFGLCVFGDSVCEEWQLYNKECSKGEITKCKETGAEFCYTLYEPVCGFTLSREWKTFSNDCAACRDKAIGYKNGECEVK